MLRFITNLKKRRNEKLNLGKFIRFSEINYFKILWFQANQQTLEKGQNFSDLKNTLDLEKDKNDLDVRVNDNVAFYGTGVDYLGPLYCKGVYVMNSLEDDFGLFKSYVVLYTCASTRGVVLELVLDASSKYFLYS